jgi:hypothetical protein
MSTMARVPMRLLLTVATTLLVSLVINGCSGDDPTVEAIGKTPAPPSAASPTSTRAEPTAAGPSTPVPVQPTATSAPMPTTVEEVYERVEETLRAQGGIFYVKLVIEQDAGEYSYDAVTERWVDVRHNVVREESEGWSRVDENWGGNTTTLVVEGTMYTREYTAEISAGTASSCYGASHSVSALLGCPSPTETSQTTVEHGSYGDTATIILLTHGESHGSDSNVVFTSRLYLDADSLLPLAHELDGEIDYGPTAKMTYRAIYTHEFLAPESLPDGFFEPGSIGYTGTHLTSQIENAADDIAVYWLGLEFDPGGEFPELVLDKVEVALWDDSNYGLSLQYRGVDDPYDWTLAVFYVWQRDVWDEEMASVQDARRQNLPCHSEQEIMLADGQAAILMGSWPEESEWSDEAVGPLATEVNCSGVDPDDFSAVASIADTVLEVQAPDLIIGNGFVESPYNSREGIEAIVRGLTLYQP